MHPLIFLASSDNQITRLLGMSTANLLTLATTGFIVNEEVNHPDHQSHQSLIPYLGFPTTGFRVLLRSLNCLLMTMNITLTQSRCGCYGLQTLVDIGCDIVGDFLPPFPYIEFHRALIWICQGYDTRLWALPQSFFGDPQTMC